MGESVWSLGLLEGFITLDLMDVSYRFCSSD